MTYTLTIWYFEFAKDVLLKESVETEHKLGFKSIEDAKKYTMNKAYSYFDDLNRVVTTKNESDNFLGIRIEEISGESRYECSAYIRKDSNGYI